MSINTEVKPFIYLALNFLVGGLVARGLIDKSVQDQVVTQADQIVGMAIIFATSIVTLIRVIKHPHTTLTTTTTAQTNGVTTQETQVSMPVTLQTGLPVTSATNVIN